MPHMVLQALQALKDRMWIPIELKEEKVPATSSFNSMCADNNSSSTEEQQREPKADLIDGDGYQEEDDEFKFTSKHVLCFVTLLCGLVLAALDYSGIGNIMSQISRDLNATTTQSEWIGNGYSLAACVMQLPISSLSDIFGRRNLYMASLVLFSVGSIICGSASSMEALIAGRCIQGAGSSGLLVLPEVILADLVPLRQRGLYYCIFMLAWCTSSGTSPLIAGALAEYSTWRWYFYMNLFIAGIALVGSPIGIKLRSDNHDHWREKLKTVDYIGAILIVGSTTSLLYALSTGGSSSELPWSNWSVIFPLILGVVGIIATGFYEAFAHVRFPMFNYRVFGNMSSSLCYLQNVIQGIINMGLTYFLPTFFQGAKGYGELISGLCILPLELVGPPVGVIFGYLIGKLGHYHFVNLLMWAVTIVGSGLLTLMNEHRGIGGLLMMQVPFSIGISCLYTTLSLTANATNPPHLWTDSTAMMSFCRSIGDSLGTAIGGAVFASQMHQRLSGLIDSGKVPKELSLLSIVTVIKTTTDEALRTEIVAALTSSMRTLFIVITVFAAVGFATTMVQKEYSLNQEYESKQGIEI